MPELTVNLHMHTPYSDGTGTHEEIAQAALKTGVDVVIVTDHNVLVHGPDGYYEDGQKRVLLLTGEEVHDRTRHPQKNHLLVLGMKDEAAGKSEDLQLLLDTIQQSNGLSFLAHPVDPAAPAVGQPDISWEDWAVNGFTGIELWNGFSEFKSLLKSKVHAVYYAYQPDLIARGPFPEILSRWDQLLEQGERVVAVGGSDAHALDARLGPLRRTLFPYQFHFQGINTHLITPQPLSGDLHVDQKMVYDALRAGHAFIGYDRPAPTRGFKFHAKGKYQSALMGDEIIAENGITLQITLPLQAECVLVKDGTPLKTWKDREICTHITTEPGVFRVEAYLPYRGQRRGWIFSNPIYVKKKS
jgi:hypothetical protein